jgi:hypothetical protein
MGIAIWVLQVLLGLFFVFHAYLLLWPSPERLQEGMGWVLEMPAGLRQFAGVAEGGLPWSLRRCFICGPGSRLSPRPALCC